jgi:formate-dependent phosphoribosylglycinamide formyltransferase (GAR transformylase)
MNVTIGTPFKSSAIKVLLCGSGELGKEVVLELQRFGRAGVPTRSALGGRVSPPAVFVQLTRIPLLPVAIHDQTPH